MAKLWGGRFDKNTDAAVTDFHSSIRFDARLYRQDIRGSIAHATMLAEQGIISNEDAAQICEGLQGLLVDIEQGLLAFDVDAEDIHMNIEKLLTERIGSAGARLHTGRSRNDQVTLDTRMYVMQACDDVREKLNVFIVTLCDLASAHLDTAMPGYTHLQRAQPITLAHHLMAYTEMLGRDAARFQNAHAAADVMPLGSGALAGTTFPLNRHRVAELLGFSGITANSLDGVADRDYVCDFIYACSLCMVHLSRLCEELILWSSQEFGFVTLDDAYATGSSIMPQKKNPDTAELMRGKSGTVVGALMSLITICKGLPLSYNRDLQEATPHIIKSAHVAGASVRMMAGMLSTLTVHEDVLKEQSVAGFTTATELADTMVRDAGIPFRTAHQIVGTLSRSDKMPTLKDIDAVSSEILGYKLSEKGLTEDAVSGALDPMSNVERRLVVGGPAPIQIRDDLSDKKRRLSIMQKEIWALDLKVEKSLENLTAEVKKLI